MKSIAVVYASEGTGHRIAAENLASEFLRENPDGSALCADILDYIPPPLAALVSNGYVFMARHVPWAWGWFYWGSDRKGFRASSFDFFHELLCKLFLPKLEREIEKANADAVFFTHYFGADVMAKRLKGKIPVFCVNTDYITHRFQRGKNFAASFVASPNALAQYEADGLKNVFDSGIPVAEKYADIPSKEEARAKLNIVKDIKTVLVSGGGIGAGEVDKAIASLAENPELLTIAVCGNNKRLKNKLGKLCEGKENVRVLGFADNMQELYAAADLAVMKPGGLSVSEVLACGLPMLLINPVPGQEQLNTDYLVKNDAAMALADSKNVGKIVAEIFGDEKRMEELKQAALRLARPGAAKTILETAQRLCAAKES